MGKQEFCARDGCSAPMTVAYPNAAAFLKQSFGSSERPVNLGGLLTVGF
jgi:hypothetical protein